jgi:NADPH-ferrihemoprotein reductase
LEALTADLSDFDPESIAQIPRDKIAIFILSTYGDGDPSDNATAFLDWLTRLHKGSLSSLRYGIFGLGNSDYPHYNRVVDVSDAALVKCDAQRLATVGRADDAAGTTTEDFLAWTEELFAFFRDRLLLEEHDASYDASLEVVEDDSLQLADLHAGEPVHLVKGTGKSAAVSPIKALPIQRSCDLFASAGRRCLHLELDLNDQPQVKYRTGDHLAVWPVNPDQEVERLISVLGLSERRHVPITVRALDPAGKVKVPTPLTIDTLFRHYLEICAPIPRDILRSLVQFAPSPATKTFLLEKSKDKDTYSRFLSTTHVNIGRLLELATACEAGTTWSNLPISYLIETLPRTQPRYYSISSSSVISPRRPSITVSVSDTLLVGPTPSSIPGLATNFLLALSRADDAGHPQHPDGLTYSMPDPVRTLAGCRVHAHVRQSKFRLPVQASCPLVMIASGTGLAPFRAFIAERLRLQTVGKPVGAMLLFFGCRRPDEDYIYRDELEEMEAALRGKLRVVTAFSRQEEGKRAYVQDRVRERGSEVVSMLTDDANLYFCGRAAMARDAGMAVSEAMRSEKGWDETQTREWSEGMKRTRKWQEDVWG